MRAIVFLAALFAAMDSFANEFTTSSATTAVSEAIEAPSSFAEQLVARVKRFIFIPPDTPSDSEVVIDIWVLPDGTLLDMKLVASSGFAPYERAVQRALNLAQPLPVPDQGEDFKKYRRMRIVFRPS